MADQQQSDKLDEVKACTPADAKASLRRVVAFGGGDGYGQDKWNLRMAQCIEDLEVALASQIEITNTERAAKERLEREVAALRPETGTNNAAGQAATSRTAASIAEGHPETPAPAAPTGDTPRTDEAEFSATWGDKEYKVVSSEVARQLERRLAEVQEKRYQAEKALIRAVSATQPSTPVAWIVFKGATTLHFAEADGWNVQAVAHDQSIIGTVPSEESDEEFARQVAEFGKPLSTTQQTTKEVP